MVEVLLMVGVGWAPGLATRPGLRGQSRLLLQPALQELRDGRPSRQRGPAPGSNPPQQGKVTLPGRRPQQRPCAGVRPRLRSGVRPL
jgi:hypothetical protein